MVDLVPRAVCLGEAMIMLAAETGAPLEDVETFRRSVGGAECNVAGGLAALGIPPGWVSRLGADGSAGMYCGIWRAVVLRWAGSRTTRLGRPGSM